MPDPCRPTAPWASAAGRLASGGRSGGVAGWSGGGISGSGRGVLGSSCMGHAFVSQARLLHLLSHRAAPAAAPQSTTASAAQQPYLWRRVVGRHVWHWVFRLRRVQHRQCGLVGVRVGVFWPGQLHLLRLGLAPPCALRAAGGAQGRRSSWSSSSGEVRRRACGALARQPHRCA